MIKLTGLEGESVYLHPNRIIAIVRRGGRDEGTIVHSDAGAFVVKESVDEVREMKRIIDARKKANKKRNEVTPV